MSDTIKVRASMVLTDNGKWAISGIFNEARVDWDWLHEACDYEYPAHRIWVEFDVSLPPLHIVRPTVAVEDSGEIISKVTDDG